MKYSVIYICVLFFLLACEPDVKFKNALPPGIESIDEIPVIFHGTFMCVSDSSRVYVNNSTIIMESHYVFETSLDKVDETENCSIVAGGLYLPVRKECIPFEYISEDSIRAKVYELDTMLRFNSNTEAVKYHEGHLYINKQGAEGHWSTWLLSPEENGSLLLRLIDIPENKEKIEAITSDYETIQRDSMDVDYVLNPSFKEFEQIIVKNYLKECEELIPVNLEIKVFKN